MQNELTKTCLDRKKKHPCFNGVEKGSSTKAHFVPCWKHLIRQPERFSASYKVRTSTSMDDKFISLASNRKEELQKNAFCSWWNCRGTLHLADYEKCFQNNNLKSPLSTVLKWRCRRLVTIVTKKILLSLQL